MNKIIYKYLPLFKTERIYNTCTKQQTVRNGKEKRGLTFYRYHWKTELPEDSSTFLEKPYFFYQRKNCEGIFIVPKWNSNSPDLFSMLLVRTYFSYEKTASDLHFPKPKRVSIVSNGKRCHGLLALAHRSWAGLGRIAYTWSWFTSGS